MRHLHHPVSCRKASLRKLKAAAQELSSFARWNQAGCDRPALLPLAVASIAIHWTPVSSISISIKRREKHLGSETFGVRVKTIDPWLKISAIFTLTPIIPVGAMTTSRILPAKHKPSNPCGRRAPRRCFQESPPIFQYFTNESKIAGLQTDIQSATFLVPEMPEI